MAEVLPSRRDDIVVRRYSLNGLPPPTLADPSGRASGRSLSDEYGISRERVRQLEKDALKRLRHPARRLERIALETAKEVLGRSDPGGCN